MLKSSSRTSPGRRNFIAVCVTVLSVGLLYSRFDTVPAGEDISLSPTASVTAFPVEAPVPIPPDEVEAAKELSGEAPQEGSPQPPQITEGGMLDGMETIKFCTLLLHDGARYMENLKDYTVTFHKEERVNGDLQKPQTIDMKVQHSPHFAVYMKWKNGDRGRQILFSEQYEDGCMVVKLGGLKRILPALKLDPAGANAMSESRYPVTQAGVAGMIRQLLVHREKDLERGSGVHCVRLPDQEFDQRRCYAFLVTYESPEICEVYRKSILLMDAHFHIPVMVRNFTWAKDCNDLTEEELDRATLIENYSFTGLKLTNNLVALDFSRENPRYRM